MTVSVIVCAAMVPAFSAVGISSFIHTLWGIYSAEADPVRDARAIYCHASRQCLNGEGNYDQVAGPIIRGG